MKRMFLGAAALFVALALFCTGCGSPGGSDTTPGGETIAANFTGLNADGSVLATTAALTLVFDKDITGLAAGDITITPNSTGAAKGALTRTGTGTYKLALNGITQSGQINVAVAKSGYTFTPVNKDVTLFYFDPSAVAVSFNGIQQDGSASITTTALTLTFDKDITNLNANDITVIPHGTGAAKGALTRVSAGVYQLALDGVSADGTINVVVAKSGYTFNPASRDVTVFYYSSNNNTPPEEVVLNNILSDYNPTTAALTLSFNKDIGLSANDITITPNGTGAVKGSLLRTSPGVYDLSLNGITQSGTINVALAKSGYTFTPANMDVFVNYTAPIPENVYFSDLTADGSGTSTTTALTLTFDKDIAGLSASDITITPNGTGTMKKTLTKTNTGVYELALGGITANGKINVAVAKNSFTFSPANKDVNVFYYGTLNTGIGIGDGTARLYLDNSASPLEEGGTTEIGQGSGTYTVGVSAGTYTEINWYLNGTLLPEASMKQSIVLSGKNAGTCLVTVEAKAAGEKNSGSHTFVMVPQ